jgi:hypothetical protein
VHPAGFVKHFFRKLKKFIILDRSGESSGAVNLPGGIMEYLNIGMLGNAGPGEMGKKLSRGKSIGRGGVGSVFLRARSKKLKSNYHPV